MRSRLLLSLAWLGGTLASIAVVWQGLRFEPERRDLDEFTTSVASPARGDDTVLAPTTVAGTDTPLVGGGPGSTGSSTVTTASTEATASTAAPQSAPIQSSPTQPAQTVASLAVPSPPAAVQTTFELLGGSAAVRFAPEGATVLWATPAAGFSVEIEQESRGPKVEFRSEAHRSRLDVWWDDGPRHEIEERAD